VRLWDEDRFLGLLSSFAMLELFKHHARKLIWASLIATPIFFCGLALLAFAYLHQPILGVVLLLMAALNCLYLYFVRARINFSANILRSGSQALAQSARRCRVNCWLLLPAD
jgi:hypothetical protein